MSTPSILLITTRKKIWLMLVLIIGFAAFVISVITPPFMSPDEIDHLKRAYGLLDGTIILEAPAGQNSGVQIDSGLNAYMDAYYMTLMRDRSHKFSADEIAAARNMRWTGDELFSPAPGTGFYFPLLYAPQAVGLAVGKLLDLTIDISYRLARLFSLVTVVSLLIAALLLCDPPPLAIAFLMLPMTLFQFASASLDGVSVAMGVLAISIFIRLVSYPNEQHKWLPTIFCITLVLLVSTRIYLLPMLALPFAGFYLTKCKTLLLTGITSAILVFAWIVVAIKFTVDKRVPTGLPTSEITYYYLIHPVAFLEVLYDTLASPSYLYVHTTTFIGNLGWFDTPLPQPTYHFFIGLLLIALLMTLYVADLGQHLVMRLMLFVCAVGSVVLIFFALLVTWNLHPASLIQGIQGRYFLLPAILLAYAIAPVSRYPNVFARALGVIVLSLLIVYSTHVTLKTLVNKFYILEAQAPVAGS